MATAPVPAESEHDPRRQRLAELHKEVTTIQAAARALETRRKELMHQYLHGPRKLRAGPKQQLDRVRQELLDQQLRRADVDLQAAALEVELGLAPARRRAEADRVRSRLRSALAHEDWLVWTRSVWKFKDTESTAKTGRHPAQFSAVLPFRLIQMYSYLGETVLDPFVGLGTTLFEAWKLERHSIGIDINPDYVRATRERIERGFDDGPAPPSAELSALFRPVVYQGDARTLAMLPDESVQLIVTHPPYWNAVRISDLPDDLSACDNDSYDCFLGQVERVFRQMARVLQADRVCCVVTGDVMRKVGGVTQLFPLHADYLALARRTGFVVWDTYIWETKMRDSRGKPMMGSYPFPHKIFSQFAHNYILVFRKSPPR